MHRVDHQLASNRDAALGTIVESIATIFVCFCRVRLDFLVLAK